MILSDKSITIVVTTCSKFSDLWENYKMLLEKYWPNHPDIIFITDFIPNGFDNFSYPIYAEEGDYSFRLKNGLSHINTDFVLLTLDDYLIKDTINTEKLSFLLETMKKNNIDYCRIFRRAKTKPWFDRKNKIKILPLKKTCYEVNLYTSIWNKKSLEKIINYDENPWKFEVRLTRRARENNYQCISSIDSTIFPFVDTVRKGKYIRRAYKFLKNNKLYISDRQVRTKKEEFLLWIRTKISDITPPFIHNWYNKMAKNKPYSFYANNDD